MRKLPSLIVASIVCYGQSQPEILKYPLPDALIAVNGDPVTNARTWRERRRPEILHLFAQQVFGETPRHAEGIHCRITSSDAYALGGLAVRRQVTVFFEKNEHGPRMHLLLYVPAAARKRVPVFVALNFFGNETVDRDPGIDLPEIWVKAPTPNHGSEQATHYKRKADESDRGRNAQQWQVEKILSHGFGLATAYCGDIDPDFLYGSGSGVRRILGKHAGGDAWGTLGAWAWGLSRAVDYLETDASIDSKKIAIMGFSRLGKAALWSAAQDTRFSLVISNESGVGGAFLYRAATAETIEHLNTAFPYWFCENFHRYTGHPEKVPVDGNLLLSLMAPRPLYVASAEEDRSSDPPAEFLSAVEASKVYELLGKKGLGVTEMPALNHPVMTGSVGYHVRSGKHDVTAFDWDQYLAFAELHFGKR